ncbi:MAG: hypothetical protein KDM91_05720 [Verrucomicrobiae bacterium]|nr:hypothetical protein [Verrucomicrobiae bacterium]MCP5542177.1 hypothetical protein [Akkermansiaceae bacterium]
MTPKFAATGCDAQLDGACGRRTLPFPYPLKLRLLAPFCLVTASTFAADAPKLPAIPTEPIAKEKERLFSDDFERAELGKETGWAIAVPMVALENGALKGTQTRFGAPAKDSKPAVNGHRAVIGTMTTRLRTA